MQDQKFIADALHSLLSRQLDLIVVGAIASLVDSLPLIARLQPDLVICEFRPDDESAAMIQRIHEDSEARIILLAHAHTEDSLVAAIECGASALLTLSTGADELVHAVRVVGAGETLIMPATIAAALDRRRRSDGVRDKLTTRERQALHLLSDGRSNRQIAARMGISYTTVRSHLRNAASKLAAHSKLELLVKAQRLQLVDGNTERARLSFG